MRFAMPESEVWPPKARSFFETGSKSNVLMMVESNKPPKILGYLVVKQDYWSVNEAVNAMNISLNSI